MRFGPIVASLLGSFGGRALGGKLGGNAGAMIGSLAGSLLGGQVGSAAGGGGGLGGLLGGLLGGNQNQGQNAPQGQPARLADANPIPDLSDDHAKILISAMCSAAKSDGTVDEAEMTAITSRLGDLDAEETAMIRSELSGPVDLPGLIARVPRGFEHQVYGASLLAIDSVNGAEAAYLKQLADGLGLTAAEIAEINQAVVAQ
jgi:uncharacterized membrane protein YebE (DUF533 family)